MSDRKSQNTVKSSHELENREAEKLVKELESPLGAQKLGDEAYELVKREMAEKGIKL